MENNTKVKKPFYKRWWFIAIVVIVFLGAIGNMLGGNDEDSNTTNNPNLANSESSNKKNDEESKKDDKQEKDDKKEDKKDDKEPYVNTAEAVELFTGEFIVGQDVKPGRYDITCESGSGNFFVYEGIMPVVNEILTSSIDTTFNLGVTKIQYDLVDGQKITISGINKVFLNPSTIELRTTLCSGTHIVGRDVPAGDYIATAPNGSGNFFVYSSLGLPRVNEILGEDTLGMGITVEKIKLTLKNGEKVVISGLDLVELTK